MTLNCSLEEENLDHNSLVACTNIPVTYTIKTGGSPLLPQNGVTSPLHITCSDTYLLSLLSQHSPTWWSPIWQPLFSLDYNDRKFPHAWPVLLRLPSAWGL